MFPKKCREYFIRIVGSIKSLLQWVSTCTTVAASPVPTLSLLYFSGMRVFVCAKYRETGGKTHSWPKTGPPPAKIRSSEKEQERERKRGRLCVLLSNMQEGVLKAHPENSSIRCHAWTRSWKGQREDEKAVQRTGGGQEDGSAAISWAGINCWANVAATYGSPLCATVLARERTYLIFHNLLQHGILVTALLCRGAPPLGGGSLLQIPLLTVSGVCFLLCCMHRNVIHYFCDFYCGAKQVYLDF